MYNFSGVFYRIWGVCGIMLLLGIICIILEKPWKHKFNIKKYKIGLLLIAFAILFGSIYLYGIVSQNVSSYTGEFVETHRNSRVAPPLPVTYEYVFGDGEDKKQKFFIDIFSKKKVFPDELEKDKQYTITFEKFSKVIVKVEETVEKNTSDGSVPDENDS